ncbi:MAG: hypothetical protein KZQ83_01735 [gamma proteobacterium symbiont of Taylorina sp.]|nr:hypothetical protein [gamma proteobacterium symbiont of Taylorina sp.]
MNTDTAEHIEFFNKEENQKEKCKLLAENYNKTIEWEKLSVSEYSPGVVDDNEFIARQIFTPIHVEENGEIKTAAFDDALNKGLSVNRLKCASEDNIHKSGELKAEHDRQYRPDRQYIGFIKAEVSTIRSFWECEKRVYTAFDTALKDTPHHSDVCVILFGENNSVEPKLSKKTAKIRRRLDLKRTFGNLIEPVK